MLDNVKCEMEEVQEMKDVCDLPRAYVIHSVYTSTTIAYNPQNSE
jgi:hypothetical protein